MNYVLLSNAIKQAGPWKGENIQVTKTWYLARLREKIVATDWKKQVDDVARFLKKRDVDLLENWGVEFFLERVDLMEDYMHPFPMHPRRA